MGDAVTERSAWSWRQAIVKSDLPSTTKLVLLTISIYMNEVGGGAYPSTKTLADDTSLSQRAVCEHLGRATEAGWLIVSQKGMEGQGWARNSYEAAWPKGADAKSARSEKALTLTQEGTDFDDGKALTDGQSILPTDTSTNRARGADGRSAPQGSWYHGYADVKGKRAASRVPPTATVSDKPAKVRLHPDTHGVQWHAVERLRGKRLPTDTYGGWYVDPDEIDRAVAAMSEASQHG